MAQHRAAQQTVETAWPYNEWLLADERVEQATLDLLGQPDHERVVGVHVGGGPASMGRGYVLWHGVAAPLPPAATTDACEALARVTAPALGASTCDRCGREGCTAAAVVTVAPHLVGLTFCGRCSAYLATSDPAARPLRWALPALPTEGDAA